MCFPIISVIHENLIIFRPHHSFNYSKPQKGVSSLLYKYNHFLSLEDIKKGLKIEYIIDD